MAKLFPFRAVRPTRDKAHLVASRPVATYKSNILSAKLEENPYTFIHIIHPEFFEDDDNKTLPNTPERFAKVRAKYKEFKANGIFIQDEAPAIYIYRQTKNNHAYLGIIAGASVAEYKQNLIKKHEATITAREEMFTNYLDIVGINAEPVLLCHTFNEKIDALLQSCTQDRPEYEFTTTDKVKHELWVLDEEKTAAIVAAYEEISCTYIADGHHRSASSVKLAERIQNENATYFLSFFIDERKLNIFPFNRICKTMNGMSLSSFLEKIAKDFSITPLDKGNTPNRMHDIHVYCEKSWCKLSAKEHIISHSTPTSDIDAELLTQHILAPHFNIVDLKTDDNISFLSGEKGIENIEQKVDKGVYKIGFALHPVSMEQLMRVADNNAIMPPKSTWVEPKLRSGLTIYPIRND
jgi:uncharacterized protein (DUF1015 family)